MAIPAPRPLSTDLPWIPFFEGRSKYVNLYAAIRSIHDRPEVIVVLPCGYRNLLPFQPSPSNGHRYTSISSPPRRLVAEPMARSALRITATGVLIMTKAPQGIPSGSRVTRPARPRLVGGEPSRRLNGGKPSPRGWPPTGASLENAAIRAPAELWY